MRVTNDCGLSTSDWESKGGSGDALLCAPALSPIEGILLWKGGISRIWKGDKLLPSTQNHSQHFFIGPSYIYVGSDLWIWAYVSEKFKERNIKLGQSLNVERGKEYYRAEAICQTSNQVKAQNFITQSVYKIGKGLNEEHLGENHSAKKSWDSFLCLTLGLLMTLGAGSAECPLIVGCRKILKEGHIWYPSAHFELILF